MYIITNAMQNLIRNKGRNLMVGGIILVMIVCVVTALMINNTATSVIDDYKNRFSSEVFLSPNTDKLREQAEQSDQGSGGRFRISIPQISPEEYVTYGDSEFLQKAEYNASTNANADKLTAANADLGPGGAMRGFSRSGPDGQPTQEDLSTQFYFKLNNQYTDFTGGTRILDTDYDTALFQSRYPESQNECMLSADVMEASGLTLGDVVTVTGELTTSVSPSTEPTSPEEPGSLPNLETTEVTWNLSIVGVYTDLTQTDEQLEQLRTAWEDRRNEILTTFDTLLAALQDGKQGISVSATYYLKDPTLLESFDAELRAKGLSDVWTVSTDSASYNQVVRPVEALKSVSTAFLLIVLVFGAIILALLSSIAIRERKYEIGVLRAMGMTRPKVVAGLWTETLTITAICLVLGLGIGIAVAQPVTNVLYEKQITAIESENSSDNQGFPPGGQRQGGGPIMIGNGPMGMNQQTQAKPLENLDIALDWKTIAEIIAIALLLSSVAGVISTIQITKYEPIKILMERA